MALAATLLSLGVGTEARGGAVSVDMAEGVLEGAPWDQMKPRVQRGLFHLSSSVFLCVLSSGGAVLCLVFPVAMVALVSISTRDRHTVSVVPVMTDWGFIV